MIESHTAWYESPIGWVRIVADGTGITAVDFPQRDRTPGAALPSGPGAPGHLLECAAQLAEYFEGRRTVFDVRLSLTGTPFQKRVWTALLAVPYGEKTTYKEIAASLGNVRSTRAVGGANHRNPVSIIVPCHRVIGATGGLTGYGGGLWRKAWLLEHERMHSGARRPPANRA